MKRLSAATTRRWIIVLALSCILAYAGSLFAAPNIATIPLRRELLRYPPLAKSAGIAGAVVLRGSITSTGRVTDIVVDSGHPLLTSSAKNNLDTWQFDIPLSEEGQKTRAFRFVFSLQDRERQHIPGRETTWMAEDGTVYVQAERSSANLFEEGCPDSPAPPRLERTPKDTLTLSRSGCYGSCPSYVVLIRRDGTVTWDGKNHVSFQGTVKYKVDADAASRLIDEFSVDQVWELCTRYWTSVTDSATTTIDIEVGGVRKSISDYAGSSPEWFQTLTNSIDGVTNTHRLRHGKEETEPLVFARYEYLPKPGKTPLMDAALNDDAEGVDRLLSEGADIEAMDASGWTALMYAVANHAYSADEMLVKRGANIKHRSTQGDTVLMAAALAGYFDGEFAEETTDINTQNREGLSVLMILSDRADVDDIEDALAIGADARLRDRLGRTALHYFEAQRCGKSLVPGVEQTTFMIIGGCSKMSDDEKQIRKILRRAMKIRPTKK